MKKVSFRPAVADDLPGIVALLADDDLGSQREDSSMPLNQAYIASFAALESDPNQLLAVVENENLLLGCLQITFVPGLSRLGMLRGQIESVRVAAEHRAEGLGRTMFEWAIDECRRRGCGLVQLTTDKSRTDALPFYEALGFTASHEGMKLSL